MALAIRSNVATDGLATPRSILEKSDWSIPAAAATWDWVKPLCTLAADTAWAN